MPDDTAAENAAELSQTYADLLSRQSWQVDVEAPAETSDELSLPTEPTPTQRDEPETEPHPLAPRQILEAMLFVGGEPLTAERAGEAIRGLAQAQFVQIMESLDADYRAQGRPYYVRPHGGGYCLELRPRFRSVIEKLSGSVREVRLSPVAIDVLSLVAYRQPVTKQEVDTLRGADSGGLLRQLVRHGLVAVAPQNGTPRETAYITTQRFLEMFGLKDLDDLPQTQDLEKL